MVTLKSTTRLGPKGQVVIPQMFREALGMAPGEEVIIELEEEKIGIEKPKATIEEVFETIAKSPSTLKRTGTTRPHHGYEEEIEARWAKIKRRN